MRDFFGYAYERLEPERRYPMPIAVWCVLVAALLPYVLVPVARGNWRDFDNALPREAYARGDNLYRKLAYGAHLNGMEVFPFFAVAVLVALSGMAGGFLLDVLAVLWVLLRLGYMVCYLRGWATARSALFGAALLVTIAIFTMPVWYSPALYSPRTVESEGSMLA